MKLVLIPDSFKGTMNSLEICDIMSRAVRSVWSKAEIVQIPVADGGEGSVDAFLQGMGGRKEHLCVQGPYGEVVEGFYGVCKNTAVVEMAAAAGLPLAQGKRRPDLATTYGVGQLLAAALERRETEKIVLGLGGSATNDGGCGAAAALGARFLNSQGKAFVPTGATLSQIESIDLSGLHPRLREVPISVMCDIDNPLCGSQGAAAVFGPQKGADAEMVKRLDEGLRHLACVIRRDLGKEILELPGAGAAGGMGGGMAAFLDASLQRGIDVVLDLTDFDKRIQGADLILTGEGRIDGQSLRGKVVIGVAERARKMQIPVAAIVGDIVPGAESAYQKGICGIFTINRRAVPYEEARLTAREDLDFTVRNLLLFWRQMS